MRTCCTLKQVQELIGFLQFCMQVIPHSRTFIRGLINFATTFKCNFTLRHIPAYAQSDILWWLGYAQSWNGVQILAKPWPTLHVYTDASGLKGLGSIFEDEWFSCRYPHKFRSRDIHFKEIYAVMQAILRWGHHWEGCHINFHIDNTAIVSALSSGTIWNSQVMNILRSIVMLAARMGFSYSSIWIPSIHNLLTHTAFRFEYAWLFQMAPSRKPVCRSPSYMVSNVRSPISMSGLLSVAWPHRLDPIDL